MKRFGSYILEKKIAIGGMAEIYLAHTSNGQAAAIKKILPHYAVQPKFVQMFLDEASLVIRLKHPKIVELYEFGKVEDTYYFSMEWVDGKSLAQIIEDSIDQRRLIPISVILILMADVLEALDFAHDQRDRFDRPLHIVHRDISPPNILVTRQGVAKIADFGVAKARSRATQTQPGIIRGKFSYMSPEQSFGEDIDARSDLFSAGIVLFEALTGERLFLKETEMATIEAVRKARVPKLEEKRSDCPPELISILMRALERDPKRRYNTAKNFLTEIQTCIANSYPNATRGLVTNYLSELYPKEPFDPSVESVGFSSQSNAPWAREDGKWMRLEFWFEENPLFSALRLALLAILIAEVLVFLR